MKRNLLFAWLAAATVVCRLNAAEGGAKLAVGDPAPKLQVGKWVQGEPVKAFEKGTAYIVEFWATWCGPCRVSIPHLNEIHKKFKDKGLVVIGQDCWERDEAAVAPFIKQMGDKMTYRVAMDDKEGSAKGKMAETWMEAAGQNGIPSAFVVDKQGLIAWIGHPMTLKDATVEKVLDGTFDVKKEAAEAAVRKANEDKMQALAQAFGEAMQKKDWDTAQAKLDEAEKVMGPDERDGLSMARFDLLVRKKEFKKAFDLAGKVSEGSPDNAALQNQLAWSLVARPDIEERDLGLAETIANRANKASNGKDPGVLDTVARIQFMSQNKDKAIELQQKAVDLAEGRMKEHFKKTLDSYKEGKLPPVGE